MPMRIIVRYIRLSHHLIMMKLGIYLLQNSLLEGTLTLFIQLQSHNNISIFPQAASTADLHARSIRYACTSYTFNAGCPGSSTIHVYKDIANQKQKSRAVNWNLE